VVLHLTTERYYALDVPSTRMLRTLVRTPTFADAVEKLRAEFEVDADVLRRDLERFVSELVEQRIVVVDDG
jgi:hypothetical protein